MKRFRFKFIFEFIFLFALNGVMLWYFRGYLNLLIAAGMIVLLLYALISVHIVIRHVSLSMEAPADYIPKDTAFNVKIKLKNPCILPLVGCRVRLLAGNVFMGERVENDLVMPIRAHAETEAEYPLRSLYAGNIEITAEKLILQDLLSFHTVNKQISVTQNVFIIPSGGFEDEFSLNAFEQGMNEVEESKLKGSDFSDVSQVREYIPGDAMKNIHWKLSAKRDNLMVKERLQMSSRKLMVVLKLEKISEADVDRTVETLYSFGNFMIQNRVPVTICWWSEKFNEIREEDAQSAEEWLQVMLHIFYTRAGSGFIEEHFRSLHPGQGYVLASCAGLECK